jgi:hypothetical protein
MIASNIGGNLGNHMWHYTICRSVAQKIGYEWGVDPIPIKGSDYFNGMNQMYFMDVDFGKEISGIEHTYKDTKRMHNFMGQDYWFNKYDPGVMEIKDNTHIQMIAQTEDYFLDIREDVLNWFKIKDEYDVLYKNKLNELGISLDDNMCIINFRGGEYRGVPNLILNREYWKNSIDHMLSINKDMKFIVITDDPACAQLYMPYGISCLHIDIGFDFYVVNKAKYLILSNSSFGWWAGWLNTNSKLTIAPKYWISHNVSNGFWSLGDSYTSTFSYMDRNGKLSTYDECKEEALDFYKKNNLV